MIQNEKKNKINYIIFLIGTTLAVYFGFEYILPLVIPFIFAYFIARIVSPIVYWMEKKWNIPLKYSGPVTILIFISILLCGFGYLLFILLKQISKIIKNLPTFQNTFCDSANSFCQKMDGFFGLPTGSSWDFCNNGFCNALKKFSDGLLPNLTSHAISIFAVCAGIIAIFFIIIISALLLLGDMEKIKNKFHKNRFYKDIRPVTEKLSDTGWAYLKAEGIIISIVAVICTLGLFLMRSEYALLFGIGIAIFDAFPIVGSGSILFPWALIELINRNMYHAAILLTLYILCMLVREYLEPKLIGDKLGIKPIFTIMAIYIGIQIFGVSGIFLGPIAMAVIMTIIETRTENQEEEQTNLE